MRNCQIQTSRNLYNPDRDHQSLIIKMRRKYRARDGTPCIDVPLAYLRRGFLNYKKIRHTQRLGLCLLLSQNIPTSDVGPDSLFFVPGTVRLVPPVEIVHDKNRVQNKFPKVTDSDSSSRFSNPG